MVLHEYAELINSLTDRLESLTDDDPIYPMIKEMLRRATLYMDEALACDSLVLATIFHPSFRLSFFALTFGEDDVMTKHAEDLLRSRLSQRQEEINSKSSSILSNSEEIEIVSNKLATQKVPKVFQLYKHANTSNDLGELDRYLQGLDPLTSDDLDKLMDPKSALVWWSVCLFLFLFN